MTSTSLNIAGKLDRLIVDTFDAVSRATSELGTPFIVVGATARDLILHHAYGLSVARATRDIDFGIEVPDWAAFTALKERLCELGFQTTGTQHRLTSPLGLQVDIVPFGRIEDGLSTVAWPPDGDIVMNVLGFQDAYGAAEWVRIREEPPLDVPVATPAGLVLLKIIAWSDPARIGRRRDATDIAHLLLNYERLPGICDALYGDRVDLMEAHDWDLTRAAAQLLGAQARAVARPATRRHITQLATDDAETPRLDRLAEDMCADVDTQYDRNRRLLSAFMAGLAG
jgi:predicted nucleotidyltransferase